MVQLTCRTGSDKLFGPTTLCLAQKRCERPRITHVFADGAAWIASVLKEKAPNAIRCTDPFHEVKWATEALDEVLGEVRRAAWNFARKAARTNEARRGRGRPLKDAPARPDSARGAGVKNSRYARRKNPENLTEKQR